MTVLSQITLDTIWDDEKVNKSTVGNGTKRIWTCGWCSKVFQTWNATNAMSHVLRTRGADIAICPAQIPVESKEIYLRLKAKTEDRKRKRFTTQERLARHIRTQQQEVVDLNVKMPARKNGRITPSISSTVLSSPTPKTNSTWTQVNTSVLLYFRKAEQNSNYSFLHL